MQEDQEGTAESMIGIGENQIMQWLQGDLDSSEKAAESAIKKLLENALKNKGATSIDVEYYGGGLGRALIEAVSKQRAG
jgi:hypothetical protein